MKEEGNWIKKTKNELKQESKLMDSLGCSN